MNGDHQPRRGVTSPAEAPQLVASRYGRPIDEATQIVIDGCVSGEIAARVLPFYSDDRGGRPATPADFDDSDFSENQTVEARPALIAETPEAGARAIDAGRYSLGIIRIARPEIEINLLSLFRCTDAIFGEPPAETQLPTRPKNRGGRPAKHDWHRAMGQILLRVRDLGIPKTQAELVNETLDWFGNNSTAIPDRRAVERWIADFWPRGPRELGPSE